MVFFNVTSPFIIENFETGLQKRAHKHGVQRVGKPAVAGHKAASTHRAEALAEIEEATNRRRGTLASLERNRFTGL